MKYLLVVVTVSRT